MTLIIIGIMLLFVVSIVWTWHNLGNIEKPKKVVFIIIGLLITYLLTMVLYNLSNPDITYPSEEIQKAVSNTLTWVFTGLNALIFLPLIANVLDKILKEEINNKKTKKRIIIILVIFVVCIFIEKGYIESTQEGIMNIYNEVQNAET